MIKVNIVCVGRVKEKYFEEGIAEYAKRLSRYCEFKIIEVEEENFKKAEDGEINIIKEREGERILPHLKATFSSPRLRGKSFRARRFPKS